MQNSKEEPDKKVNDFVDTELRKQVLWAIDSIDRSREPKNALTIIRDILKQTTKDDRVTNDPEFANYIYDVAAPGLVKKLTNEYLGQDRQVSSSICT